MQTWCGETQLERGFVISVCRSCDSDVIATAVSRSSFCIILESSAFGVLLSARLATSGGTTATTRRRSEVFDGSKRSRLWGWFDSRSRCVRFSNKCSLQVQEPLEATDNTYLRAIKKWRSAGGAYPEDTEVQPEHRTPAGFSFSGLLPPLFALAVLVRLFTVV